MLLGFKPNQNDSVFSVFFLKSKSLSKSYFFSCQQDKEILEVCGFVGSQEYWNSFLNSLSPHRPCHHQFKLTMRLCHNFHFLSAVMWSLLNTTIGLVWGMGWKQVAKHCPITKLKNPDKRGCLHLTGGVHLCTWKVLSFLWSPAHVWHGKAIFSIPALSPQISKWSI